MTSLSDAIYGTVLEFAEKSPYPPAVVRSEGTLRVFSVVPQSSGLLTYNEQAIFVAKMAEYQGLTVMERSWEIGKALKRLSVEHDAYVTSNLPGLYFNSTYEQWREMDILPMDAPPILTEDQVQELVAKHKKKIETLEKAAFPLLQVDSSGTVKAVPVEQEEFVELDDKTVVPLDVLKKAMEMHQKAAIETLLMCDACKKPLLTCTCAPLGKTLKWACSSCKQPYAFCACAQKPVAFGYYGHTVIVVEVKTHYKCVDCSTIYFKEYAPKPCEAKDKTTPTGCSLCGEPIANCTCAAPHVLTEEGHKLMDVPQVVVPNESAIGKAMTMWSVDQEMTPEEIAKTVQNPTKMSLGHHVAQALDYLVLSCCKKTYKECSCPVGKEDFSYILGHYVEKLDTPLHGAILACIECKAWWKAGSIPKAASCTTIQGKIWTLLRNQGFTIHDFRSLEASGGLAAYEARISWAKGVVSDAAVQEAIEGTVKSAGWRAWGFTHQLVGVIFRMGALGEWDAAEDEVAMRLETAGFQNVLAKSAPQVDDTTGVVRVAFSAVWPNGSSPPELVTNTAGSALKGAGMSLKVTYVGAHATVPGKTMIQGVASRPAEFGPSPLAQPVSYLKKHVLDKLEASFAVGEKLESKLSIDEAPVADDSHVGFYLASSNAAQVATSPAGSVLKIAEPEELAFALAGKKIFSVLPNGKIICHKKTGLDEMSQAFWEAIESVNPAASQIKMLQSQIDVLGDTAKFWMAVAHHILFAQMEKERRIDEASPTKERFKNIKERFGNITEKI